MHLPKEIPPGVRIVARTVEGRDPEDGRLKFRDYIGHVISWDGTTLDLSRDPSANGSREAQKVRLTATSIVGLKPIPERRYPAGHHDMDQAGLSDTNPVQDQSNEG